MPARPPRRTSSRPTASTYATVDLTEHEYRGFYLHFANGALWPLLHFRLGLRAVPSRGLRGLRRGEPALRRGAKPLLRPDDLIWVHDYHLFPFAEALRAAGGRQSHRLLPAHALCAARAAARAAARRRPAAGPVRLRCGGVPHPAPIARPSSTVSGNPPGRAVRQRRRFIFAAGQSTPSSIRSASTQQASPTPRARADAKYRDGTLRDSLPDGRALAIGADRLDYSKGLPNRFEAFGRLLTQYPAAPAAGQPAAGRSPLARGLWAATSGCDATSTGSWATSTGGSPNSTGCRCAT